MQKMNYKIININNYNNKIFNLVYNNLNEHDKNKIIKMPKDRMKHFILARYILLQNNIDISKINYNENGKPYINNKYFSISHSNKYTVVCISNEPVGVDIEYIKDINESIKSTFGFKDKSDIEFLKHFTKVESYIKLNGLALKNFNDNIDGYDYKTRIYRNYIITICNKKSQ